MLLLEELEEVFKDVHIKVEYQPVEISVHAFLFKPTSRDFFRETSCTSNVLGKDSSMFFRTEM